jgi:hypothetical protein
MNLLSEVTQKAMAVYLDKKEWEKRYYVNYFPLKYTPFLSFETLIGSKGISAAEIVSYNSSAPEKTRRVVDRLRGDLPAIRVKRIMDEKKLNEYNVVKATVKNDTDMQALLDLVYGDVDFVIESVQQRCEWLALQALSQTKISLTSSNSAGLVTEEAINFGLPTANKEVCGAANRYWLVANSATCKPITDIQAICTEARAAGVKIKHILMNVSKFTDFKAADEVKDFIYGIMISEAGISPGVAPTLKVINQVLTESGMPDIQVIDTYIDLENADHDITSVDPWLDSAGADKYISFIPELPLGRFLHGPIAAETVKDPGIIQDKTGHVLVQSISEQDPVQQKTVGLANCFVSFDKINQVWSLNSESHTSW